MATSKTIQPTNQTVQIPAMTDAPDMSVVANALDKTIDGVNTLNSHIVAKDLGTITSLSDLQSALNTQIGLMSANEIQPVEFYVGTTAFETFNAYERYIGQLKCTYATSSRKDLIVTFESGSGDTISIGRFNGTWSYNDIRDQKVTGKQFTIIGGNSVTFTMTNNSRITLICSSAYTSHTGIINLSCSNSGVAEYYVMLGATGLSISASGNTVTISATNGVNGTAIIHAGSIS